MKGHIRKRVGPVKKGEMPMAKSSSNKGGGGKGGGNPNYPSTTGNPSGPGRGNEPKGK